MCTGQHTFGKGTNSSAFLYGDSFTNVGILSTLQNASSSVSNQHVSPYGGEFLDQTPLIGYNKPIVNDNCLTF